MSQQHAIVTTPSLASQIQELTSQATDELIQRTKRRVLDPSAALERGEVHERHPAALGHASLRVARPCAQAPQILGELGARSGVSPFEIGIVWSGVAGSRHPETLVAHGAGAHRALL